MTEVMPDLVGAQGVREVTDDAQSRGASGADHVSKLMSDYFEKGQAKRDRMTMAVKCGVWFFCFIVVIVIAILFLPEFLETGLIVGREMEKEKDNAGLIVLYLFLVVMFVAAPFPGRGVFNLILGYVYHWPALPILFFGHVVGGYIAFTVARLCWPYLVARGKILEWCCCCCTKSNGQPSKTALFVLASLAVVEEKPFQSVFLLVLSPIPLTVMSYILGAKCNSLKLVTYLTAMALGGVKVVVPVYLGTKVHDLTKLIQAGADRDPVEICVTSLSIFFAILIFAIITRRAYIKLQQAQEGLKKAGAGSGDDIDRSDTNTVLSLELCKEYARSQAGEELAPETPRKCVITCSFMCLALGAFLFFLALSTLVRLTPMFEGMSLHIGPRTMCPETIIQLPWLEIPSVNFTFPVTLTNTNPVRIESHIEGSIYEAIGGKIIGYIVPSFMDAQPRERSLFNSGSPEKAFFKVDTVVDNVTATNIPGKINLLPYLGSAPGTSDSPCPLPIEGDTDSRAEYLQCMRTNCADANLGALSGRADITCDLVVQFLGCDGDLSEHNSAYPQGTYVRNLCAKSCNNCGRLLQSNDSALQPLETAVILELKLTGLAKIMVLGNIQVKKEISLTRYIRKDLRIPMYERVRQRINQLKGEGGLELGLNATPMQCFTQHGDFIGALCSHDMTSLLGEKVGVGGAVTRCGLLEVHDEENISRLEERKWIGLIFIMFLACCCMGGSCYCCTLQGQVALRARKKGQRQAYEVAGQQQNAPSSLASHTQQPAAAAILAADNVCEPVELEHI